VATTTKQPDWILPSLSSVAEFYDVPAGTVRTWRQDGMPGTRSQWDLKVIDKWVHETGRKTSRQKTAALTEDPLFDETVDSEGLERYRMARAQLEEIKLAEQRGQVVLMSAFQECARSILSPLRKLQETLKRRQDHDTFGLVEEAIDEMDRGLSDAARREPEQD
jgi:phage terminase Nu1 subunit (DNA packaging protein)